jgi:hypothetical protein
MDFKETDYRVVEWIQLAQDWNQHTAFFNMVMNFLVPRQGGEFLQQLTVKDYVPCR